MNKAKVKYIGIILLVLIIFIVYQQWHKSTKPNELAKVVLLLPDDMDLENPQVKAWLDMARVQGLPLAPMYDSEFLHPWFYRQDIVGLILPDQLHKVANDLLIDTLSQYVVQGGHLMLVYDAGIWDESQRYVQGISRFSPLVGVDYGNYSKLRDRLTVWSPVLGNDITLGVLQVPPQRRIPYADIHKQTGISLASQNLLPGALYGLVRGPQTVLSYDSFYTGEQYSGQALLQTPKNTLVAGIHKYGEGKVLFANLPLTYLQQRDDDFPMRTFLRYFIHDIGKIPYEAGVASKAQHKEQLSSEHTNKNVSAMPSDNATADIISDSPTEEGLIVNGYSAEEDKINTEKMSVKKQAAKSDYSSLNIKKESAKKVIEKTAPGVNASKSEISVKNKNRQEVKPASEQAELEVSASSFDSVDEPNTATVSDQLDVVKQNKEEEKIETIATQPKPEDDLLQLDKVTKPPVSSEQINEQGKQYIEANRIEGGVGHHNLTNGFGEWDDIFIKASWQQNEKNIWNFEVSHQDHFNDSGIYYAAGITHIFNEDWYGSLTLGGSSGAFFLPKLRADAFINRKLLKNRNLIVTIGLGYDEAQRINSDRRLYLGASYYFDAPWVLEGGVRLNRSSPGPENSTRFRVAATYGRVFERYITAEFESGNEAYQFIGQNVSVVDFDSEILTITWREWVRKDWGFVVRGELYDNDIYKRNGVEFSVFKHF